MFELYINLNHTPMQWDAHSLLTGIVVEYVPAVGVLYTKLNCVAFCIAICKSCNTASHENVKINCVTFDHNERCSRITTMDAESDGQSWSELVRVTTSGGRGADPGQP